MVVESLICLFVPGLFPFSIMSLEFIHVAAYIRIVFLSKTEEYSIIFKYHILEASFLRANNNPIVFQQVNGYIICRKLTEKKTDY